MIVENKIFENLAGFQVIENSEYYCCIFAGCDFSGLKMRKVKFDRCEFRDCNFSMTKLSGKFSDVLFKDCKLIGSDFTTVGVLSNGFLFDGCCLDYANLMSLKLRKTSCRRCRMIEANFDEADLTSAIFEDCNLERTTFDHANLTEADFTLSYNFTIHPDRCRLKKTKFSESGLRGLVAHLDIVVE